MPKQPAFPGLRDAMKKKQTRRELFLSEMDAVVPWVWLMRLITPHYLKAGPKGGRPPIPIETCQATRQTGPVATRGTGPLAKLRGKSG
jgi:IS5 family transposase